METLILHNPTKNNIETLNAFLQALKIEFSFSSQKESPYNSEFVKKIKESKQEILDGKSTRVEQEDFKKLLGLE
jgi:arsenate reductase-like glutaredoxin family protein